MMNNELFQNVFDKIQDGLTEDWDKVVIYIAYYAGSYTMKYYVKEGKEGYIDCYNIPGITNAKLVKLFMSLDKIISPEEKKLGAKKWTVMTMIVTADGDFKSEFDYSDINDNSLEYEESWQKKYLK